MSVRAKRFLVALATGALFAAPLGAQSTDARVTGRITDPAGAPIPGASVLIRELAAGASTSENGTYTLTVAASRLTGQPVTIIARAIGFSPVTRNITLTAGANSQDFQLARDPLRLEAVVVTGVAEETESRRLGFAIGKVDEAQLKEVPAMNPVMALAGKVSGARVASGSGIPGAETSIRLRSATSITPGANNAPLVVVDGIITKGGLSDINSQDIESIEILKGPASAGIYGSDAAAGVINVITRRGRNAPEGKTVVTLRNEYGSSSMDRRLPLNQSTNCKARVTNASGVQDFPRDAQGRVTCPASEISIFYDQPYPAAAPFRNQQDAIIGNGEFYTNYLSVARRSGNTNFQASFENLHNGGIIDVPGITLDGLNRRNVRLNVDQFVRDNLDMSVGAFYTSGTNQTIGQGAGSTFFSILFMPPDVDLFAPNANGEPFRVDAGRLGATVSSDANPLYDLYSTKNTERRSRVQGSFRARYRPMDWLSFDANYGYDRTTDDAQTLRPKNYLNSSALPQGGRLVLADAEQIAQNASITAALTHTFNDNINAIVRGSYLYEDEQSNSVFNSGSNFGAAGVPQLGNLDPASRVTRSAAQTLRARNAFGQVVLDIADRVNLDGLIRRDGSSLFGSDARWRNFYRATGSYLVSQDLDLPNVNEFRLRLSRGTAGLRPPFEAQYETFTVTGGQIIPAVLGNKNLKPAYATETEAGFNLGLFNRMSVEYSFANKVTRDQVLPVPLSSVNGFTLQWQNAATIEGKTHEVALGFVVLDRPEASWQLNITGDRTRQKVTELNTGSFRFGAGCGAAFVSGCNAGAAQSSDIFLIKAGEALGAMYGTHWVRTCDELKVNPATRSANCADYVQNPDGLLVLASTRGTANERAIKYVDSTGSNVVKIGDANPDFSMGLSSNLQWKNFTVYGVLDMVKGGSIYNLPRQWLARSEFRAADADQGGKPDDQKLASAYYAAINDANNFSDYFVESGSYAKLREMSVGYTMSPRALQSLRLNRFASNVRMSLIGRNLFTWTDYTGLDPEVSAVGAASGTGETAGTGDPTLFRFDAFGYPNFRTFSFMIEFGM